MIALSNPLRFKTSSSTKFILYFPVTPVQLSVIVHNQLVPVNENIISLNYVTDVKGMGKLLSQL